ncbi:MAG TPA: ATP-binding protein [Usitatibacteraceae bacterium]
MKARRHTSLRRAIAQRLAVALVLALLALCGAIAALFTQINAAVSEQQLNDALGHFRTRIGELEYSWATQAEALRTQLEFSHLLEERDLRLRHARLNVFLSNLGADALFTNFALVDANGKVVYRYRSRALQDLDLPPARRGAMAWVYGAQQDTLYRTVGKGMLFDGAAGTLVMYASIDDSLLSKYDYPNAQALLLWQGKVVAESRRAPVSPPAGFDMRWRQESTLERVIAWEPEPGGPELRIARRVQLPLSVGNMLAVVVGSVLVIALLGWLAIGRWLAFQSNRLVVIENAVRHFAEGQEFAPSALHDLDAVGERGNDEVSRLARGTQRMMQEIAGAQQRQRQASQQVLEMNAELERRVEQRTQALQAVNRELETFSYSVAHDLRSPLRVIVGYAAILRGKPLDDECRLLLDRIEAGGKRMGELIDALLKMSNIGRVELRRGPVDLSQLVVQVMQELQVTMPARVMNLHIEPALVAEADPVLLRAVLENLLGNAFKYSARADVPAIEFGRVEDGDNPAYFVRDNGAGFDMKYVGKLFRPFQRMHSASAFEGLGIGLATAHRIIERHGGRIWAESAPGRGATFYFTLG